MEIPDEAQPAREISWICNVSPGNTAPRAYACDGGNRPGQHAVRSTAGDWIVAGGVKSKTAEANGERDGEIYSIGVGLVKLDSVQALSKKILETHA